MWTNPLNGEEVCPERKLAVAVLLMAVEDAKGKVRGKMAHHDKRELQAEAQAWLAADSWDLAWWCEIAETTPDEVRALLTSPSTSMNRSGIRRSRRSMSARRGGGRATGPTRERISRGRGRCEGQ